jgi:hypothetical protein
MGHEAGVCPILNFFQAKERAARVIRDAESQPPGTQRLDVFVANTDAYGNGRHWFTVAIEVTTKRTTDAPQGPRTRSRTRKSTNPNGSTAGLESGLEQFAPRRAPTAFPTDDADFDAMTEEGYSNAARQLSDMGYEPVEAQRAVCEVQRRANRSGRSMNTGDLLESATTILGRKD